MSYLLFTSKYTSALIDVGYNDASKRIDEIEDLLPRSAAYRQAARILFPQPASRDGL